MSAVPHSESSGKRRLADAAALLFSEDSYERVSVAQILAHAQVQAPTLYYHFGDKEGLFVAWAEDALARFGDSIRVSVAGASGIVAGLTGICRSLAEDGGLDLIQTLRDASKLSRPESGETILQSYLRNVYEPLCSLLLAGMERREIRAEPVGRLTNLFLMGAFATGPASPLPGASSPADAAWWPERFVRAFAP